MPASSCQLPAPNSIHPSAPKARPAGSGAGQRGPASDGDRGPGTKSPDQNWSGRRGSNPRPTAWKAVTLPLSYSRTFLSWAPLTPRSARVSRSRSTIASARQPSRGSPTVAHAFVGKRERRLVARGGFEPPKSLGRQIYSLLRLTASLPRRYAFPATVAEKRASFGEPRWERHA